MKNEKPRDLIDKMKFYLKNKNHIQKYKEIIW